MACFLLGINVVGGGRIMAATLLPETTRAKGNDGVHQQGHAEEGGVVRHLNKTATPHKIAPFLCFCALFSFCVDFFIVAVASSNRNVQKRRLQ
jgi:hypothetical protein